MTSHIRILPRAQQDVEEHFAYIAPDSMEAASRFLEAVRSTLLELTAWPELGGKWEFHDPRLLGIRVSLVRGFESHLIFYRPIEQGIEVIRVLHASRDIDVAFDQGG